MTFLKLLTRFSILLYCIQGLFYVFQGAIHLDEASYLYASRAVVQGSLPYRDFFYLQPPLHPYIYGVIQSIQPGLLTGRLTSFVFGFLTLLLCASIASRIGGRTARALTVFLMAVHPFQIYFHSITRLYALSGFWIALGLFFLIHDKRPGLLYGPLSLICLALATGTRLTLAPVLVLASLYLLVRATSLTVRVTACITSALTLCVIFLPFVLSAGFDRLMFNLLGMNLSLHSRNPLASIVQKLHATSQFCEYYFLLIALLIPPIILRIRAFRFTRLKLEIDLLLSPEGLLWTILATQWTIHLSAKIYQVSYQTPIMPIGFILAGVSWEHLTRTLPVNLKRIFAVLLMSGGLLSIVAYGRTSIGLVEGKPARTALEEQVRFLSSHAPPGSDVFSADSSLVPYEAGMNVLKGMSGSDLFPDWTDEQCREYNVLNFNLMRHYIIEQTADIVIYGDRSFTLSLPYLEPIPESVRSEFIATIERYYERIGEFPNLIIPDSHTYYLERKEMK